MHYYAYEVHTPAVDVSFLRDIPWQRKHDGESYE